MMNDIGDSFTLFLHDADYRDMFKFYFEPGGVWKPDARARSLNPGDNYNTHIDSMDCTLGESIPLSAGRRTMPLGNATPRP